VPHQPILIITIGENIMTSPKKSLKRPGIFNNDDSSKEKKIKQEEGAKPPSVNAKNYSIFASGETSNNQEKETKQDQGKETFVFNSQKSLGEMTKELEMPILEQKRYQFD